MPSSFQSALIGALSGTIEVIIQQPTIAWKTSLQAGTALPLTRKALYRGTTINALSITPITAIQFSLHTHLTSLHRTPTIPSTLAIAAAAGLASSVVASPAEHVMILQQRGANSLRASLRLVCERPFRGLGLAGARDAIFATGYLGLAPMLASGGDGKGGAGRMCAAGVAGVTAAFLSQPFDTVKTIVQSGVGPRSGTEWCRGTRWDARCLKGLYNGMMPRCMRIIGAFIILQESKLCLETLLA